MRRPSTCSHSTAPARHRSAPGPAERPLRPPPARDRDELDRGLDHFTGTAEVEVAQAEERRSEAGGRQRLGDGGGEIGLQRWRAGPRDRRCRARSAEVARIVRVLSSERRPQAVGPNRLSIVQAARLQPKRTVQPSDRRRSPSITRSGGLLCWSRSRWRRSCRFAGSVRELVRRVHLDHHPPERRHEVWPGQQRMVRRPTPYQEQTELARLDAHERRGQQQPEHESQ